MPPTPENAYTAEEQVDYNAGAEIARKGETLAADAPEAAKQGYADVHAPGAETVSSPVAPFGYAPEAQPPLTPYPDSPTQGPVSSFGGAPARDAHGAILPTKERPFRRLARDKDGNEVPAEQDKRPTVTDDQLAAESIVAELVRRAVSYKTKTGYFPVYLMVPADELALIVPNYKIDFPMAAGH